MLAKIDPINEDTSPVSRKNDDNGKTVFFSKAQKPLKSRFCHDPEYLEF